MWLVRGQFDTMESFGVIDGEDPGFLIAPACEPAYDFRVTVYCSWLPGRRRWSSPWPADREELARIYEIVRATIRTVTREHSIFRPAEAERAVNARLIEELEKAKHSDQAIRTNWTARAELGLPDEVIALMRKTLDEEYSIRAK